MAANPDPTEAVDEPRPVGISARFVFWTHRRSGLLLAGIIGLTALAVVPFLKMRPTATASQEPGGFLFEARSLAADRFASGAHRMVYVVEARKGDLLRPAPLRELLANIRALRADPKLGTRLLRFELPFSTQKAHGVISIAEAVDERLREAGHGGLAQASDAQVARMVDLILTFVGPDKLGMSAHTRKAPRTGRWSTPAFLVVVLADNQKLGGGGQVATLGAKSTHKEQFARQVLSKLRGQQRHLRVWGLAVDVNLTSMEQGRSAGPFIGLTIFAVLLLVGLVFRSYWVVALVGFALGCLMLWLQGGANLLGLKSDQILSIVVPIAMISFGVDFAFHAVGRYREARGEANRRPGHGYRLGMAGALGALLLALCTDAAAFLSNTSSSIESLIQFGVAAALGTLASFVLLGLFVPLALMRIDERLGSASPSRVGLVFGLGGSVLAALGTMAVVVFMVFVRPWLGALLLAVYGLVFVLGPAWILGRRARDVSAEDVGGSGGQMAWLGRLVAGLACFRAVLLPGVVLVTAVAVFFALRVDARFDVKDFFSPRSDFVVGLDKFDHHFGQRSGEPALIYVDGALDHPDAAAALVRFVRGLRAANPAALAKDSQGQLQLQAGLVDVLEALRKHPPARQAIAKRTGVALTDKNADGVFDTQAQLVAVYQDVLAHGVRSGAKTVLPRHRVRTMLWRAADGKSYATQLQLRIPGTRSNENIEAARRQVDKLVSPFKRELRRTDNDARVVFTGMPIVRQASLDAILRAFRYSLLIAVAICFLLAAVFMRSLRYAVVSIVPILIVVTWLYAFMYLAGYSINVVTATIGAISIGVGIDFAVHFTMRFREECREGRSCEETLATTGAGTGGALLGSALSSVLGFAILAFAPMPMFAAYGLLTAVMILIAAGATLLVLPSLLMLAAPTDRARCAEDSKDVKP